MMDPELMFARSEIMDLKSKLEFECRARKRVEMINKKIAKELFDERRVREAMEKVCEELAKEISSHKAEINRMKKEMDEERKMLRMAEVIKEEAVQMKLNDAKIFFEEKLVELIEAQNETLCASIIHQNEASRDHGLVTFLSEENIGGDSSLDSNKGQNSNMDDYVAIPRKTSPEPEIPRKTSPEPENPHIKRGIKGFVEFPRGIRAIGSKSSSRHWGNAKLECQKAQLRILLERKSPIGSSSFVLS